MKTGARERDSTLAGRLLEQRLKEASALETAGWSLEAYQRFSEAAEDFRGLADTKAAEAAAGRLAESGEIRQTIGAQERLEEAERRRADRLRESLAALLQADPPLPLQAAVNQLQLKKLRRDATEAVSEADRLSAARVLEELFVQTSFYLPRRSLLEGAKGAGRARRRDRGGAQARPRGRCLVRPRLFPRARGGPQGRLREPAARGRKRVPGPRGDRGRPGPRDPALGGNLPIDPRPPLFLSVRRVRTPAGGPR